MGEAKVRDLPYIYSEFDLLGQRHGIIEFDSEISNRALQLPAPEQKLNGPEVAGLTVDLGRLGSAHGVRAVGAGIHPGPFDPRTNNSGILARR